MTEEELFYIWFHQLNGIGCKKKRMLLEHFLTPQNIFFSSGEEWFQLDEITKNNVEAFLCGRDLTRSRKIADDCERLNIHIMTIKDKNYPILAKNNPDCPIVLYYKGNPKCDFDGTAIVGARRCTGEGKKMAVDITKKLVEHGISIISGMAKGIDSYALTQCVIDHGYAVAILANGLDICYPSEHSKLKEAIENTGLLLSEYPPGTPPRRYSFPKRNRIIAACAKEIYVLEPGRNSGSLITARYGEEYGKKVYRPQL